MIRYIILLLTVFALSHTLQAQKVVLYEDSGAFFFTKGSTFGNSIEDLLVPEIIEVQATSFSIDGDESIIFIDPATVVSALTITLPASPSSLYEVDIHVGGQIVDAQVVGNLTITPNGAHGLLGTYPLSIYSGDGFKLRFYNNNWYIL